MHAKPSLFAALAAILMSTVMLGTTLAPAQAATIVVGAATHA
jgi:hypothetical protein